MSETKIEKYKLFEFNEDYLSVLGSEIIDLQGQKEILITKQKALANELELNYPMNHSAARKVFNLHEQMEKIAGIGKFSADGSIIKDESK